METIEIYPLGKTQREQWENAVHAYCHCIRATMDNPAKACETLGYLESEVIRFMENVFDILEKED